MVCFAEEQPVVKIASGLEAMLYRGFIERAIARHCLELLYPKFTIEWIASTVMRLAIDDLKQEPELAPIVSAVEYQQAFEAALARAMKDELMQMAEGN